MPSRRAVAVVLVLVAVGAVVTQTGGPRVQRPAFGVADSGDRGAVRDDGTEIVRTSWVRNPNRPASTSATR